MRRPAEYVIDASVGIKQVVTEERSDVAGRLLTDPEAVLHVPDLFFVECANVLWKKVQRGEFSVGDAAADLVDLRAIDPSVKPTLDILDRALAIANAEGISVYDACYVALADMLGIPLVTADDRLAAKLAGTSHQIITLSSL